MSADTYDLGLVKEPFLEVSPGLWSLVKFFLSLLHYNEDVKLIGLVRIGLISPVSITICGFDCRNEALLLCGFLCSSSPEITSYYAHSKVALYELGSWPPPPTVVVVLCLLCIVLAVYILLLSNCVVDDPKLKGLFSHVLLTSLEMKRSPFDIITC